MKNYLQNTNLNKTKHCRITILSKDKYYINIVEKLLNNQLFLWNNLKNTINNHKKLDNKILISNYNIKKNIYTQILKKKKYTLLKSPHVHKKAKKTFQNKIYKINIFLETNNSQLKFSSFIKNNIIYNLPKAENITYKIWTSNKKQNIIKLLKIFYKKKINILKNLKSFLKNYQLNLMPIKKLKKKNYTNKNNEYLKKLSQEYNKINNKIKILKKTIFIK